jgi:hypothetical protein
MTINGAMAWIHPVQSSFANATLLSGLEPLPTML